MALRRPPTRIELKADDVEEYDKIMKERRDQAEAKALQEKISKPSGGLGYLDSSSISLSSTTVTTGRKKKISAASRIGYKKNPR